MISAYGEKLQDPRWQKKRLKIMERDGWTCQGCGDKQRTLHVHHIKYDGEPWEIEDQYLTTLCGECHEYEHSIEKEEELRALSSVVKDLFLASEIEFLLSLINGLAKNKKIVTSSALEFALFQEDFVDFVIAAWSDQFNPELLKINHTKMGWCNILSVLSQ